MSTPRVMVEYPGYTFDKKIARLVDAFDGGFLGTLFTIEVDGVEVALTKDKIRLLREAA